MLLLARAVDDRTALNETNARKLYGPFLRPMSHVLGSQPMTEFGPGACTLATLGASNVTGRQSTTDGLLSSDLIRRIRHQPPTGRGELTDAILTIRSRPRCTATFFRFIDLLRVCISQACARSSSPRDTFLR